MQLPLITPGQASLATLSGTSTAFTMLVQFNEVLKTISAVVGIVSGVVLLAYTIWKWGREAAK